MRACGTCTLCCRLLPTREIAKPANTPCPHQRFGKGCTIYETRPTPCRVWSCQWLLRTDTADLRRPDRAGYVIDIMADYVVVQDNGHDDLNPRRLPVVQVWVDPSRPHAHRDKAFRAYAERRATEGFGILLRYGSQKATVLLAPALNNRGEWVEWDGNLAGPQHTPRQIMEALTQHA